MNLNVIKSYFLPKHLTVSVIFYTNFTISYSLFIFY